MNQQQKTSAKQYLRDLINTPLRGAGISETDVNELAKKAQKFQDAEAAAGRCITITEAVHSVSQRQNFNEYSNNRPGYTTWYFTD